MECNVSVSCKANRVGNKLGAWLRNDHIMPPTLKKWGTYWFWLVHVCVCVGGGGGMATQ